MNKQELIEKYEKLEGVCKDPGAEIARLIFLEDLRELDEPQPLKLKDVIARIKGLERGTQNVWLNEILNELGSDYGLMKYKDGYEQGRFDGAIEREKVAVPQFVAEWIERSKKEKRNLRNALNNGGEKMRLWFLDLENYDIFARAWLDGYTVEKEKRYSVKIKGEIEESLLVYGLGINRYFFARTYDSSKRNEHTRKQLESAGFGWVFDCPGIEIEEVEE